MDKRFKDWKYPEFDENGMTKWHWMCQNNDSLSLGKDTDIGAFTYINAKYGVEIQENVQIGSHCSIYSWSTIDNKKGKVIIKKKTKSELINFPSFGKMGPSCRHLDRHHRHLV